ncbi:hypothetical protein NL676_000344 [Syzygium grande]|nr:hypothetical protein NL676_000344 [Syzygium grande]
MPSPYNDYSVAVLRVHTKFSNQACLVSTSKDVYFSGQVVASKGGCRLLGLSHVVGFCGCLSFFPWALKFKKPGFNVSTEQRSGGVDVLDDKFSADT